MKIPPPTYLTETLPNGLTFEMAKVEGGEFEMGSTEFKNEQPVHTVQVRDFYIGKYTVTQELWENVMGENLSYFKGKKYPVERVSWDTVQLFLRKLNELTQKEYRLPSESEWEYAARGGEYNQRLKYAGSHKLKEVGWYRINGNRQTQPVGLKLPNKLGIYDMSGNVWEWCADYWHENYDGAPTDGNVWIEGGDKESRVVRGGSWDFSAYVCRPSYRSWDYSDYRNNVISFRLAQSCLLNPSP